MFFPYFLIYVFLLTAAGDIYRIYVLLTRGIGFHDLTLWRWLFQQQKLDSDSSSSELKISTFWKMERKSNNCGRYVSIHCAQTIRWRINDPPTRLFLTFTERLALLCWSYDVWTCNICNAGLVESATCIL